MKQMLWMRLKKWIKAHENSTNRKDLKLVSFVRMKNYASCRAVEQAGMLAAHTLKGTDGKEYNNQINGVGINNSNAKMYYNAAMELLNAEDNMAEYILNQVDNERLNQIENYIKNGLADYHSIY